MVDIHFDYMIRDFIEYLRYEKNRAPLTLEAYTTDIRQFSSWLGNEDPEETDFFSVTSSDVRAWLTSLAKAGDNPRTLRRKAQSLRALFMWMVKTGKLKFSPLRDMPLPKIPKPLPEIVRKEEIENAINLLNRDTEKEEIQSLLELLVIEVLYSLGLRRAELASINDNDISFTNAEIKVTGKRSKQRVIPLPQALLDKIRRWQILRDENMEVNEWPTPLFCIKGKRITHSQIYRIVNGAFRNSTAKKKSPHALRHSFASGMLNGGADLDSVREFLGHSSLATTQIYTHISLSEIKKAYNESHPRSSKLKK